MLAEIQGNQAKGSNSIGAPVFIEYPILLLQLCIFAILYAIWVLPGTIALRNICLAVGAVLSLYPIFRARKLLLQKSAIPIWLIIALFGWVIFHLLFLSQDPVLQYEELTNIWKRSVIGAIFAFGMGLSIARLAQANPQRIGWLESYWVVFYMSLMAPTLIYLVKLYLSLYGVSQGIQVSDWAQLYKGAHRFYVAKTAYVAFCLPILVIALAILLRNATTKFWLTWRNLAYLTTPLAVFAVFYFENIKNGVVYGSVFIALFVFLLICSLFNGRWVAKTILLFIAIVASGFFLNLHLQENKSWNTFRADAKIAWNTAQYQQWKYNGEKGYPVNERGITVSATNYERIAWAKEGIRLISENPLGYGLVDRSFGHLAKIKWPDSKLHQSHSGWIDLTLGIGIPGVALLLGSIFILIKQLGSSEASFELATWVIACRWVLLCLLLVWFTTEISQKVYLDNLIFWILLAGGINCELSTKDKHLILASPNEQKNCLST